MDDTSDWDFTSILPSDFIDFEPQEFSHQERLTASIVKKAEAAAISAALSASRAHSQVSRPGTTALIEQLQNAIP